MHKRVKRECMICMSTFRTAGVGCGSGHGTHWSCKKCTKQYIETTLMSKGVVYFDKVPCIDVQCMSLISSKDAISVLTKKSIKIMEKQQWDMACLLGGEIDPSSQQFMDKKNMQNCPNCKILIEKNQGCDHVTCRCGHKFWWCLDSCKYPNHSVSCRNF